MDCHRHALPPVRVGLLSALTVVACGLAPPTFAAPSIQDKAITLTAGNDGDYDQAGLSLRLAPVWTGSWGNWQAAVHPELELNRFRYTGAAAGPDFLNQGGAIARLHVHYGEGRLRPYAEAGLGLSLFSRDSLGTKHFSTHFQFSEQVGGGAELAGRGFAGLQYSHYSNADIEKPNDGIDMYQLVIGAQF